MTLTQERTDGLAAPPPGAEPVVLATYGLTKSFGGKLAVDHLDLTVRRGDVFGFLGPNGAGKTTTIRMIVGLIYPTSGYATVIDHQVPRDKKEALKHIGGFVEVPAFYGNMSARRNLRLMGGLNGQVDEARISEVLDIVGLRERADSKVGDYSHGMKQRLGIANALINKPELVILDEPTSGLDPQGMKDVRELVRELGTGGTTVFLSSHLLHEVEQVCNRAVIINRGKVVIEGPVSELHPEHSSVKLLTADQGKARDVVAALVGAQNVDARRGVPDRAGGRRRGARDGRQAGRGGRRRRRRHPRPRAGPRRLLPGPHAELRCRYRRGGRRLGRCDMMLLRREFTKLIHQKRSYVGWAGLLAVPLLITLALYLNRNNHHRGDGPGGLISLAKHEGLFMPVAAIFLLLGFPAAVAGLDGRRLPARRRGRDRHDQDLAHALHQPRRRARLEVGHRHHLRHHRPGAGVRRRPDRRRPGVRAARPRPALGSDRERDPRPVADASCHSSTCWSAWSASCRSRCCSPP